MNNGYDMEELGWVWGFACISAISSVFLNHKNLRVKSKWPQAFNV